MLAELKTDIKYIRENVKDHNGKLDNIETAIEKFNGKIEIIDKQLSNHLNEHERLRKEMFTKLGILVSVISIITAVLLKLVV